MNLCLQFNVQASYNSAQSKWLLEATKTASVWRNVFGFSWWTLKDATLSAKVVGGSLKTLELDAKSEHDFEGTACDTTSQVSFAYIPTEGKSFVNSFSFVLDASVPQSCLANSVKTLFDNDSAEGLGASDQQIRMMLATQDTELSDGITATRGFTILTKAVSGPSSMATSMLKMLNENNANGLAMNFELRFDPGTWGRRVLHQDRLSTPWSYPWDGRPQPWHTEHEDAH